MKNHDVFWKLETLSDRQLLERLGSVLGSSRRLMAELVAHLGEVEERRLHLVAACSSMFVYCLKLGMTEDEAYRRIEAARLARRYPAAFPLLSDGRLSISVLALLKHHLSVENHLDLLTSVAGKTVAQARELIAARFPRPDVPGSVRKLPERPKMNPPSTSMPTPTQCTSVTEARFTSNETEPCSGVTEARSFTSNETEPSVGVTEARFTSDETEPCTDVTEARCTSAATSATKPASPVPTDVASIGGAPGFASVFNGALTSPSGKSPPPTRSQRAAPFASRIEPLSAQRYKVQLTASAELARKLELARDLMRHSHPGGELGPIVERALDLLIESLLQRRFGRHKKTSRKHTSERARSADPGLGSDAMSDRSSSPGAATPDTTETDTTETDTAAADTAAADTAVGAAELATSLHVTSEPAAPPSSATRPITPTPITPTPITPTPITPTADSANVRAVHRVEPEHAPTSYIPRSTRRAVFERDGLGCSWVDEQGLRCGSRAWLEHDHRRTRAKGGGAEPGNVRLLCRQHNRFAAERAFGRRHVEYTIAERRRARARRASPAI